MAFESGHTALKAVRCVCVYVVLVFVMSVTPNRLGSARKVQLGKNLNDGSGGRAGGFPQENWSFCTCYKSSNALVRQQKQGLACGRVLQGLEWHFPSNSTNVLLPGVGSQQEMDKYQSLTPQYSPLILISIYLAFQGCIPG